MSDERCPVCGGEITKHVTVPGECFHNVMLPPPAEDDGETE